MSTAALTNSLAGMSLGGPTAPQPASVTVLPTPPPPPSAHPLGPITHIANISVQSRTSWELGDSAMSTFVDQPLPCDLGPRLAHIRSHPEELTRIKGAKNLDMILGACERAGRMDALREADIVTHRGIVTKLMMGIKMTLLVSLVHETLFIHQTEDSRGVSTGVGYGDAIGAAHEDMFTTGGSSAVQWANVVTRKLGEMNLLFCGEVDCVRPSPSGQDDGLHMERRMEIMTRSINQRKPNSPTWLQNGPRFYLQSHLLGVPEIVVGYRDQHDVICDSVRIPTERLRTYETSARIDRGYQTLREIRDAIEAQRTAGNMVGEDYVWKVETRTVQDRRTPEVVLLTQQEVDVELARFRHGAVGGDVLRIGVIPATIAGLL